MSGIPALEFPSAEPAQTAVQSDSPGHSSEPSRKSRWSAVTIITVLSGVFCAWYAYRFVDSVSLWWFHPGWTTDDSIQQVYPFHEIAHPSVFEGDLITEVMKGYLAPLHYWICYAVTMAVGDPLMMAHWVMLIQVVVTLGFLFAAVRSVAGAAPAFFAVAWMLHTRHIIQRLTCGLPRGWAACIFAGFLYFALTRNHKGVLCTILLGCLLNPPSAFLIAAAYGLVLIAGLFDSAHRREYKRKLISYMVFAPICAAVTLAVVHRPPQVGQMVTLEEAKQMPEFQRAGGGRPNGRFPFLPFKEPWDEIKGFAFQSFVNRFWTPDPFIRNNIPAIALGLLGTIFVGGLIRRREVIPREVLLFGAGALTTYFLSRLLAFKLYVPDRHIQFPFAFFFITALTIGVWRLLHLGRGTLETESTLKKGWISTLGLVGLASIVYAGSMLGLQGSANFNYSVDRKGDVFKWLNKNTDERALVAGHPTHLDGVQLFAIRRGYVSTETTHPFYTRYYAEMKRRTEIVLRAHYAIDTADFLALLEPEGIDYFVFKRPEFTKDALAKATYFSPLDALVRQLSRKPAEQYLFFTFVQAAESGATYVPFRDKQSLVVDVKKLREFVDSQRRI